MVVVRSTCLAILVKYRENVLKWLYSFKALSVLCFLRLFLLTFAEETVGGCLCGDNGYASACMQKGRTAATMM